MNWAPPTHLYKYMTREFARRLVRTGEVLIGTLHEFQNEELLGEQIGDSDEGNKSIYHDGDMYADIPESIPEFTKSFFKLTGPGSRTINCNFTQTISTPNIYVFCCSASLCTTTGKEFGHDYDAAVKIHDPKTFSRIVWTELNKYHTGLETDSFIFPCKYMDRTMHYLDDDGIPPVMLKDFKYAYQDEVRFIWNPKHLPICSRIIRAPALSRFCKFVSDRELKQLRRHHRGQRTTV